MGAGEVVLGGAITLAGTVVSQVTVVLTGRSARSDARRLEADKYDRDSLTSLQAAAQAYRMELVAYNDELTRTNATSPQTETRLRTARMTFQSVLHRVDPEVVNAMKLWADAAVGWIQNTGTAGAEERSWNIAAERCGAEHRRTLR